MQPRNLNTELAPVAGMGQGDVANVIFNVKVRIIDPVRVIKAKRNLFQFLAKSFGAMNAIFDKLQDIFETNFAASRRSRYAWACAGFPHKQTTRQVP